MPKKLTVAERAIVAKASQDLYRYERTCTEHSAVLRRDLGAFSKAYEEYSANSNPMGFMPPRDEFDRYIEDSEKVLKKDCRNVLEYAAYKLDGVIVLIYCFLKPPSCGTCCVLSLPALDEEGVRTRRTRLSGIHSSQSGARVRACVLV
jgi:hypothetical protein